MGTKTVILCMSVLMIYFATAHIREEKRRETSDTESWTDQNAADNECGRTDRGYKYYNRTKVCYKIHTDKEGWYDAEAICVREGGHLAVMSSWHERQFYNKYLPEGWETAWIGFHRIAGKNKKLYRTVYGQTLIEAGFGPIHELIMLGKEDCGMLYRGGSFYTRLCFLNTYFVCEKDFKSQPLPASSTEAQTNFHTWEYEFYQESEWKNKSQPNSVEAHYKCGPQEEGIKVLSGIRPDATKVSVDSDYMFLKSTNACYSVHWVKDYWKDAETMCIAEGGHLAVISNQDEVDLFMKNFPSKEYNIFLGFYWNQSSWVTIKGQTLAETGYENWNEGEPNNITGDQNCGVMTPDGKLDDYSCDSALHYICQRSPNLEGQDFTTGVQNEYDTSDTAEQQNKSEVQLGGATVRPANGSARADGTVWRHAAVNMLLFVMKFGQLFQF